MLSLVPGDILAWRVDPQASLVDRLIGWGEQKVLKDGTNGYAYYHISVVSRNPKQHYSAQPLKIDIYDLPDPLPDHVEVYRKPNLDPISLERVFVYGDSRKGKLYPILGVLTAGWLSGNLEFCSQYTVDMWFQYTLNLSTNPRFSTPDNVVYCLPKNGFNLTVKS